MGPGIAMRCPEERGGRRGKLKTNPTRVAPLIAGAARCEWENGDAWPCLVSQHRPYIRSHATGGAKLPEEGGCWAWGRTERGEVQFSRVFASPTPAPAPIPPIRPATAAAAPTAGAARVSARPAAAALNPSDAIADMFSPLAVSRLAWYKYRIFSGRFGVDTVPLTPPNAPPHTHTALCPTP